MLKKQLGGWILGTLCAGSALAVSPDGLDFPYAALQYAGEFSDSTRDADMGHGYQLHIGVPLQGLPKSAIELMYYDVGRNRAIDGNQDYQTALALFFVQDFGSLGRSGIKPFGMAGLAAVHEDVLGVRHTHPGVDLGGGLIVALPFAGLSVRSEAHALAHYNDGKSVAGKDLLVDYRLTVGLQIPLAVQGARSADTAPPAAAEETVAPQPQECELAVVDVSTGRKDCVADSDGDGVADGTDLCPATTAGLVVDAKGCPPVDSFVLKGVNFESDSAILAAAAIPVLDEVAVTLNAPGNETIQAEIVGHTDNSGNATRNQKLSEARAESVRQYLIGKGVDGARLTAQGKGDAEPLVGNDTPEGRAQNRRVEFKVKR